MNVLSNFQKYSLIKTKFLLLVLSLSNRMSDTEGAAKDETPKVPKMQPIQPHMIAPLPQELVPTMNWQAEDVPATWARFKTRMQQFLRYTHCPRGEELYAILLYAGDEASNRWETLKFKCEDEDDVAKVWAVFDGSFEKSGTFWQ